MENFFRIGLEEIVLNLQNLVNKTKFQYDLAVGNKRYAIQMIQYYQGRKDQVNYDFNFISALYENAIMKENLR